MEAGITLGLTVGSQADALTYLLRVEWASVEKNRQTDRVETSGSRSVSFVAEMLFGRWLDVDLGFKQGKRARLTSGAHNKLKHFKIK